MSSTCEIIGALYPAMGMDHSGMRLDDLLIPAGNRLESLKGDQAGRHSMRVNDQFRVTFRWENGNAYEVCVEDSH